MCVSLAMLWLTNWGNSTAYYYIFFIMATAKVLKLRWKTFPSIVSVFMVGASFIKAENNKGGFKIVFSVKMLLVFLLCCNLASSRNVMLATILRYTFEFYFDMKMHSVCFHWGLILNWTNSNKCHADKEAHWQQSVPVKLEAWNITLFFCLWI